VLISASTRRLTGGQFEYRDRGPAALKGWAEPVPAWQVCPACGAADQVRAVLARGLTVRLVLQPKILVFWMHVLLSADENGRW
jgi:class 3 adenylate cyclase